ncbi:MAG: hypothetical protein QGG09_12975, partial [Pirellulaceae bacterium]|nr:hypothetical protein [Pirellulaceae bacterium]
SVEDAGDRIPLALKSCQQFFVYLINGIDGSDSVANKCRCENDETHWESKKKHDDLLEER